MESTGCQRDIQGDAPSPCLQLEVVLVNVIEPLERQVDASKNVHGLLSRTSCVSVAPLNIALHLPRLQPDT